MGQNVKVWSMCCGSIAHTYRAGFRAKFKELIGDSFEQLSDIDRTACVLSSELNFEDTLRLMKEFITDLWQVRKQKLWRRHMP